VELRVDLNSRDRDERVTALVRIRKQIERTGLREGYFGLARRHVTIRIRRVGGRPRSSSASSCRLIAIRDFETRFVLARTLPSRGPTIGFKGSSMMRTRSNTVCATTPTYAAGGGDKAGTIVGTLENFWKLCARKGPSRIETAQNGGSREHHDAKTTAASQSLPCIPSPLRLRANGGYVL
jgi:hypothetical protein